MKWLTNIPDHRKPNAERFHCYSIAVFANQKARQVEWQQYLAWINAHIIGPPQATEKYTQQQLEKEGMIGIYTDKE